MSVSELIQKRVREREEFSDRQSDGKNEWKRENSVERKSVK